MITYNENTTCMENYAPFVSKSEKLDNFFLFTIPHLTITWDTVTKKCYFDIENIYADSSSHGKLVSTLHGEINDISELRYIVQLRGTPYYYLDMQRPVEDLFYDYDDLKPITDILDKYNIDYKYTGKGQVTAKTNNSYFVQLSIPDDDTVRVEYSSVGMCVSVTRDFVSIEDFDNYITTDKEFTTIIGGNALSAIKRAVYSIVSREKWNEEVCGDMVKISSTEVYPGWTYEFCFGAKEITMNAYSHGFCCGGYVVKTPSDAIYLLTEEINEKMEVAKSAF